MPLRRSTQTGENPGPKPFSQEWLRTPQETGQSPQRSGLPVWLPSERVLAGLLVGLLILLILPWRHSGGVNTTPTPEETAIAAAFPTADDASPGQEPTIPVQQSVASDAVPTESVATEVAIDGTHGSPHVCASVANESSLPSR